MGLSLIRRSWFRFLLVAVAVAALGWWALPFAVPLPQALLAPLPVSPRYLSSDGTPLRQYLTEKGQRAAPPATYEELPAHWVHAILAAEDKRFFDHGGVDLLAISRAAKDNFTHKRVVSGASTLTQQLIKVSSSSQNKDRSFTTKLREALQARRLEMTWDKQRILTEYSNRVAFGHLFTGLTSAAEGYLQKPLRDLTPADCAFFAALPQSPSRLDPFRNSKGLAKRQAYILQRMLYLGWLTNEEHQLASNEKLKVNRFTGGFAAPHAVELAHANASPSQEIRTTIEADLQRKVEDIIQHRLRSLENKHVTQAAAVVIANQTGRVLALAGSRAFFSDHGGQINGAWVPHSPGSALKPFTYLLALEHGYTAASIIPDLPIEYASAIGLYRPENYDRRTHGPVTLRAALGNSLNIPAVRVLHQIGGETLLHDSLCQLGITTLNEKPEHYGLGLTIGNAPVRLLELANAYACLARLGETLPWTLRTDVTTPATRQRLFPQESSYIIADILSDNNARSLTFGPHSVIRMPFRCAVKTGTSTNYRDNWTLGFTPEFTVGVWAGNFDNSPMASVSGVTGAGPIFRDIFLHLHETRSTSWYAQPNLITEAVIDPRNGKGVSRLPAPARASQEEVFVTGTVPADAKEQDYEPASGRAYLPPLYADWLKQNASWQSDLLALHPNPAAASPLRIISPVDGTVVVLDPDLRNSGSVLLLRGTLTANFAWSSPTLELYEDQNRTFAKLREGKHKLSLNNTQTGESITVSLEVRPPPTIADRLLQPK